MCVDWLSLDLLLVDLGRNLIQVQVWGCCCYPCGFGLFEDFNSIWWPYILNSMYFFHHYGCTLSRSYHNWKWINMFLELVLQFIPRSFQLLRINFNQDVIRTSFAGSNSYKSITNILESIGENNLFEFSINFRIL